MRPQGLELQQGELGDLVEQEMAATSAAVESAAARIEVHKCVWEGCFNLGHQAPGVCASVQCENIVPSLTLQQY